MSVEDPYLDHALSVLTTDLCLQIGGSILFACRVTTQSDAVHIGQESIATWMCENARLFTLIKTHDSTLVFSHTNEVLYHASPLAQLNHECPVDTAVLCQFTVDTMENGDREPRLLAFDILSPSPTSPELRGARLRALAVYLPIPLCCIQWVGLRMHLSSEFVRRLPHKVSGVVVLGQDPLVFSKIESC
jgi:hypothetical protein